MSRVFDARTTSLSVSPLAADQCPEGPVATGVADLARTEAMEIGVWEHPAGTSTDVEQDEVFVVISGSGRIRLEDGRILPLAPGSVGILASGEATTWEIDEPLRKVWVTPR